MRALYVCFGLLVCLIFVCSRAPVEPDPDPREPVPCDIVEVVGVYEIFVTQDESAPNSYVLLRNDIVLFDTLLSVPGTGEFRVEVQGTYKQGDAFEFKGKGSNPGFRYAFHANE